MKLLVLLLVLIPSLALAEKSFKGEKSGTHDCASDPDVAINTGDGTFTITGECDKIGINGGKNTIKIESVKKLGLNGGHNKVDVGSAEKIGVNGSDNIVTYKTGPGGKGKPKVGSVGVRNKITQVK